MIDEGITFPTEDDEYELVDIRQEGNIIKFVGESEPTVFRYQDLSIFSFFVGIWLALEMLVLHFLKKLNSGEHTEREITNFYGFEYFNGHCTSSCVFTDLYFQIRSYASAGIR